MTVATAEGYARMKVRLVEAAAEYGNTLESVCRRGGSSGTRIESARTFGATFVTSSRARGGRGVWRFS